MKSVIKVLSLGTIFGICVALGVLFTLKGLETEDVKDVDRLEKVIRPTVTIQYQGLGGGSGTCIFKEEVNGKIEAYFLTANHVVDFSMYRRYSTGCSPYNPVYPNCNEYGTPVEEEVLPPPLFLKGWLPKDGELIEVFSYTATIYKAWPEIDTAIVKIVEDPESLITQLPCAKLESAEVFDGLKPGHPVVCSGCPYLLPCVISKGHIGRHDFIGGNMPPGFPNHFCLVRVNIAGGASGGGIYNYDNMKVIGIVSIGWGNEAFICGMIPISDILPKLKSTYLGQRIGL